jgi:hypothetical protein
VDVDFFPIRCRNSPNTPCPVSIWAILNVSGAPLLFFHSSQLGSTAHTARCGLARVSSSSHSCQRLHIFNFISPKSTCWSVSSGPPCNRTCLPSHFSLSARAYSSKGRGGAASTVADVYDTVLYPLIILMAVILCSPFISAKLRRLALSSLAHTGAPYRTRERTTPS